MKRNLPNETNNKFNKLFEESYLIEHKKITISEEETLITATEEQLPILYENPATFFSYRLSYAFPDVRGLKWFDSPKEAVERLKILLKAPISFKADGRHCCEPIWALHGDNCFSIQDFEVISDSKILIGFDELEINKIAVFSTSSYERNFIYIEAKPEEPTGLYRITHEEITKKIDKSVYMSEEYALLDGTIITRAEYDEGTAVINGNLVDATNSQLRIRHLSKYNFIISAITSLYNLNDYNKISEKYLDGILMGTHTLNEFISELNKLSNARLII